MSSTGGAPNVAPPVERDYAALSYSASRFRSECLRVSEIARLCARDHLAHRPQQHFGRGGRELIASL